MFVAALGMVALAISGGVIFKGLRRLFGLIILNKNGDGYVVPPALWEPALTTTAAALLVLTIGVTLLRVARGYHDRALHHSCEMGRIRHIEAALRLAVTTGIDSEQGQKAVAVLSEHILTSIRAVPAAATNEDLPIVPPMVGAAKDAAVEVLDKVRGK